MIQNNNKLQEGLDSVNRIKLLMGYDMSKTLTENKENVLIEQSVTQLSQDITKKLINSLSQTNDDEEKAFNQIKRINTLEILKNVGNLVKKRTGMSLKNYIDDEMSNTFDPEYRKIMDHIDTLDDKPSYRRQGFDQPKVPIPLGIGADMIKDETGTIPYSQMRTRLTPEYKKSFQAANPQYVWDPNYESTRTWISDSGQQHEEKIKTGGFVLLTPENMGLRGTPFGFDPTEYPEYLKKVKEINKKYPKSETSILNPTTWVDSDVDDTRKKLLTDLKNQYYHEDFPGGIPQKDFLDRMKAKKVLTQQQKKELDSIRNSNNEFNSGKYKYDPIKVTYRTGKNGRQEFELDPKTKQYIGALNSTEEKYKNLEDYLDAIYEYDPYSIKEISKSALEKWWEKWGTYAELAGWVIADILTDGAVAYLTETRQLYLLAKIIKFAGRVGLPVGLGIYDTVKNEGLTEDGIFYFMFAILPWAHSYFKIPGKPSVELVESIVKKQKGLNLRNPDDVKKFMKLLTQEEKGVFRAVAKLTKDEMGAGLKAAIKDLKSKGLGKIYNTGKTVKKTIGKEIKPSLAGKIAKFGITISKDLTAIEVVKKIFNHFGVLDVKKEKEKALEEEFNKRKGTPLIIFMANAIEAIRQDPKLDINEIISKSVANFFIKNGEDATMILLNNNMEGFLQDENGNKVDRYGEPITK
jgi:hypothetical protein